MKQSRIILLVITVSLLVHLYLLLLIKKYQQSFIDHAIPEHIIPTFFSDDSSSSMPPPPPSPEENEEWAALRPGASMLSDSLQEIAHWQEPEAISYGPDKESFAVKETPEEKIIKDDTIISHDSSLNISETSLATITPPAQLSNPKNTDTTLSAIAQKQQTAQAQLAQITKGYIEQLHNEGNNLIKTIGGNPNTLPSVQQLKYERYLAKIQWCFQNAHTINKEKCPVQEPCISSTRIYFSINRLGKMDNYHVLQSSGKKEVDDYIAFLFNYASHSFPPLPDYIKEDPYTYSCFISINFSTVPTWTVGVNRH